MTAPDAASRFPLAPSAAPGAGLSPRRVRAVAGRIIRQVVNDRRTLALGLVVPVAVILLLGYVLRNRSGTTTLAVTVPAEQLPALPAPPGLRLVAASSDPEADVHDGRADGALSLMAPPRLIVRGENPGTSRLLRAAAAQVIQARFISSAGVDADRGNSSRPLVIGEDIPTTYLQGGPEFDTLDYEAPALIGFFAFFFVFLLTVVSFLRERTSGTLERLLISPLRRLELVGGYMLGFGLFALVQAALVVLVAVAVLRIHHHGALALVLLLVALVTLAAVNLGIFCSTYATTELQAIQFIPIVIVPQGLLSGLLFSVASLPRWLQVVAHALPLTYATGALRGVMIAGAGPGDAAVLGDVLVLAGFIVAFLVAAALTLRQQLA